MTAENPDTSIKSDYLLDNAWQHARERLALLEAGQDPGTIRYLELVGVGPGWKCLEVGGGGGSIAAWLCHRVSPTGQVVATDIDTRFLDALDYANLEVRRHNVASDELAQDAFDLVHSRAVLSHLVERDMALTRLVAALKPGGWLLVEEPDLAAMLPDPGLDAVAARVFNEMKTAVLEVLAARGVDVSYGRRLYSDVCACGLLDVGADGRTTMVRGGGSRARSWQLSCRQVLEPLVGTERVSREDLAAYLALLENPDFVYMNNIMMAVWGRRPVS